MSYILEIERSEEIRCAHCLSWNNKKDTICSTCTTTLYDPINFGAARALCYWEHTSSGQLKTIFSTTSKDKINHWNTIFQAQLEFFQKEFPYYSFLSKYAVLDIQDEVYKYFLSFLPMRPEVFQEFKDYEFPKTNKNEIELLNFTFRTHPSPIFKVLAGLALIQTGRADVKIVQYLNEWDAHYKILRKEKLLSFAHWSVQKLNLYSYYSTYVNEVMPLITKEDSSASWAKIYLYKADYDVDELKYALEDMITSEKTHIAISACFALRKYDGIKDLLLDDLDESTIDLAFVYSDERHIPSLLTFLKHAPRKYHETIIRRCVQLKPKGEKLKGQVVDWLLNQDNTPLLEVLFGWTEIPRFDEVLAKLVLKKEGIQALLNFFPSWMRDNQISVFENKSIQLIFDREKTSLDSTTIELLHKLQIKINEIDFEMLSENVRKKKDPEAVKTLFLRVFSEGEQLTERQVSDGFTSLIRVAENTKANEKPYFDFTTKWGMGLKLSPAEFHTIIDAYLSNEDFIRPVSNWLYAVYEMLMTNKTETLFTTAVFKSHVDFMLKEISDKRIDAGTSGKFLKLLFNWKESFKLSKVQQKQLETLASESTDFELKYWVEQVFV
ncbi:hypothetical protein [uncultured Cytophaga sp.]|uniref:hypothetical protein n=1 Tax=uncultured Cytophaga sp. TaxID=160238 RepID=UPI0026051C66|nr:hypothetical protein [uncultured Cytophaga sp.]